MVYLIKAIKTLVFFWYSSAVIACTTPEAHVPRPEGEPVSENQTEKVIIVGAGAAGLSAAYTLEHLGLSYQILEAGNDFGGRVREIPAGSFVDVPLDAGAEWIHVKPKILQDLLLFDDQAEVRTIDYRPESFSTFVDGKRYKRNWLRFLYKESKFYNTTWYSYLRDYFYPHIKDNLELNAVVTSIDYSQSEYVMVKTQDGREFKGSRVIVATPVSILQKNLIQFTPALNQEKLTEINKVDMAPGLKVFLAFDKRFYPDIQFTTGIFSILDAETEGHSIYFDGLFKKPSSWFMLTLFQVGHKASQRVSLSDEEILSDVMAELDGMFDDKASAHLLKGRVENWSKKPFIQGAYSVNATYDKDKILSPIENRLFFCGEYLAIGDENQATVHGAAISGRSVALSLSERL